ncbi:hypothetical protein [Embleya hyalina]|uniref:hypothetical protein n=1 Tax=Embleya hyalina TaxID=516124 RepID=UPI000F832CEA|nr:hypothetical protein [Embleya hyalina]
MFLAAGLPLLHPEAEVFQAMLDGWRNQQFARNLGFGTVDAASSGTLPTATHGTGRPRTPTTSSPTRGR